MKHAQLSSLFVVLKLSQLFVVLCLIEFVRPDSHSQRLYKDLIGPYSKYDYRVRPVQKYIDKLDVRLGLRLTAIADVDERNQILATNFWMRHVWYDGNLQWKPEDYGNITAVSIPAESIWRPDIVLYNNAEGNYQIVIMTKAMVHSDGKIIWEPPAIYKSYCEIDVEFFPFDQQKCDLKFGTWTYDGGQVLLRHIDQSDDDPVVEVGLDLSEYYVNGEWDLMSCRAEWHSNIYPCCEDPYIDVTVNVVIRRKTLYFMINLIIPCVCIAALTSSVFYLPADSGEKVTLCISVLLSLTVFFLLLSDIIPPTSLVTPLMGKYLMFVLIMVSMSIALTIVQLNIHFRSPTTHTMPEWMRVVFLKHVPKLLRMKRPGQEEEVEPNLTDGNVIEETDLGGGGGGGGEGAEISETGIPGVTSFRKVSKPNPKQVINNICNDLAVVANHYKQEDFIEGQKDDWRYIGIVIDRLFFWIFTIIIILGTLGCLLNAPALYDTTIPVEQLVREGLIGKKEED